MITLGKWIVFIIIAFGIPGFVQAEFYRYIDKDGNIQFTDNLANVPADQRGKIDEYEDAPPPPAPPEVTEADENLEGDDTEADEQEEDADKEASGSVNKQRGDDQQLMEAEEQLRTEYETLMKEKKAIEQTASQPLTPSLRKKIQADIQSFNNRLKDFEKRRKAHNEAVEAYNARLKKDAQVSSEQSSSN